MGKLKKPNSVTVPICPIALSILPEPSSLSLNFCYFLEVHISYIFKLSLSIINIYFYIL